MFVVIVVKLQQYCVCLSSLCLVCKRGNKFKENLDDNRRKQGEFFLFLNDDISILYLVVSLCYVSLQLQTTGDSSIEMSGI